MIVGIGLLSFLAWFFYEKPQPPFGGTGSTSDKGTYILSDILNKPILNNIDSKLSQAKNFQDSLLEYQAVGKQLIYDNGGVKAYYQVNEFKKDEQKGYQIIFWVNKGISYYSKAVIFGQAESWESWDWKQSNYLFK